MFKAAERAFTSTVQKDGAEVKVGTPVQKPAKKASLKIRQPRMVYIYTPAKVENTVTSQIASNREKILISQQRLDIVAQHFAILETYP